MGALPCSNNQKVRSEDYQPKTFKFSPENDKKVKAILKKYPKERANSAVIPLLWLAQKQHHNWLPLAAIEHIADFLNTPTIKILEVATFYTMFNLQPVGKNFIQVCRTLSCWMRGAGQITQTCKKHLGVGLGEVTDDGKFSIAEVECLGACANAPIVQINDDYYEDLTPEGIIELIDKLKKNEPIKSGSYIGRLGSAPFGYKSEKKPIVKAKSPTKTSTSTATKKTTKAVKPTKTKK